MVVVLVHILVKIKLEDLIKHILKKKSHMNKQPQCSKNFFSKFHSSLKKKISLSVINVNSN